MQWAASITDDRMRDFTTRGVFVQWFNSDPTSATAALNAANLTPEQKTAITNAVANGATGRGRGGFGGGLGGPPPGR